MLSIHPQPVPGVPAGSTLPSGTMPVDPARMSPGSPIQWTLPRRMTAPSLQRRTLSSHPRYQSHSKPYTSSMFGAISAASSHASSKARRRAGRSASLTMASPSGSMEAGRVRWSVKASTRQSFAAAAVSTSVNVDSPSEKLVCVWQSTIGIRDMAPSAPFRSERARPGKGGRHPHCMAYGGAWGSGRRRVTET